MKTCTLCKQTLLLGKEDEYYVLYCSNRNCPHIEYFTKESLRNQKSKLEKEITIIKNIESLISARLKDFSPSSSYRRTISPKEKSEKIENFLKTDE